MSEHRPAARPTLEPPPNARFAVVAARFNGHVVGQLLEGTLEAFEARRVRRDAVDVFQVPGAWELPMACRVLAGTRKYAAVVALGAVIRGETPHFDFVARGAADGCMRAQLDAGVPVVFGVLTTDDEAQALARAERSKGNKGRDFAEAAIEMALFPGQAHQAGDGERTKWWW